jgi:heme-degrading monooxygenase HmoA
VLIHHNVQDYEKFRTVFDYDAERRKRYGSKGGRLLRGQAGPNDFFALFEWESEEKAREFVAAYETHEAFEWLSAAGEVRAFVLEEVEDVEV